MPTFQCHKCELRFATENELNWHLREDHRAADKPTMAPDRAAPSDQAAEGGQAASAGGSQAGPARRARWWLPWRRSP
jgi:hypothetical protein